MSKRDSQRKKQWVKERYGAIAQAEQQGCCTKSTSCCEGVTAVAEKARTAQSSIGYSADEIAAAISAPLAKTKEIVVISTGGDSAGADRVTRDVAKIIAQLPPVVEAMTGIKLADLLAKLPHLAQQTGAAPASQAAGEPASANPGAKDEEHGE